MNSIKIHTAELGAVLRITGEDAFDYLQSQFSNDLRHSSARPVTYGLLLDRKGRIEADAFILQLAPATFMAVSYRCSAAQLVAKLEANIIADDVQLEDVTQHYFWVVLVGNSACVAMDTLAGEPILAGGYAQVASSFFWQGRHAATPHLDGLLAKASIAPQDPLAWLQQQGIAGEPIDGAQLERERIAALLPAIPIDLGPKDLPHEGGLEVSAVAFDKGCYLGQEVMARLHAMGNAQRRLVGVKSNTPLKNLPLILFLGERAVGEIRSAVASDGAWMGLALVKNRYVEPGMCLAIEPDGEPVVEL